MDILPFSRSLASRPDRVQANLVEEAHAAGGETRPLSSPFHAPRAEPASSRAILWQLAAGCPRRGGTRAQP